MKLRQWHTYVQTKNYKWQYHIYSWKMWKVLKVELKAVCSLTHIINSNYNFKMCVFVDQTGINFGSFRESLLEKKNNIHFSDIPNIF